tara:strand:+ start:336 stop:698 length:363 start_codon:yes stop_codon:yes gene_type:complete
MIVDSDKIPDRIWNKIPWREQVELINLDEKRLNVHHHHPMDIVKIKIWHPKDYGESGVWRNLKSYKVVRNETDVHHGFSVMFMEGRPGSWLLYSIGDCDFTVNRSRRVFSMTLHFWEHIN